MCEEALVLERIGITSSFPIAIFICHVVRCSELAILGFSVMLVRQHDVIFDGNLSKTLLVRSGGTTCPMDLQWWTPTRRSSVEWKVDFPRLNATPLRVHSTLDHDGIWRHRNMGRVGWPALCCGDDVVMMRMVECCPLPSTTTKLSRAENREALTTKPLSSIDERQHGKRPTDHADQAR